MPPVVPRPKPKVKAKGEGTPSAPAAAAGAARSTAARKRSGEEAGDRVRVDAGGPGWVERVVLGRVSNGSLGLFCKQLATYLDSGVDILKALGSLEEQFARSAIGPVIGRIRQRIKGGMTLSAAMGREEGVFDRLTMSMIRVAEAHGGLPEVLRELSRHYEARQRLFRQARSALIQPAIVLTIAAGVIGLLSYFVLPKMVDLLRDAAGKSAELPGPTKLLIAFSDFVVAMGWWLVPAAVIGGGIFLVKFYKTDAGKSLLDGLALRVPVVGGLLRKIDTTRFARTLSTLLGAGVGVGDSMALTAEAQMLEPYRKVVGGLRREVLEGQELSEGLRRSGRFDRDVIERVAAGEHTGRLPEMLAHIAEDYEEQVEHMVKNLGQLIQPLLILVVGGFVFFIIVAFVMAYVSILTSLSAGL
jgi:type II secretory pathway component PulF